MDEVAHPPSKQMRKRGFVTAVDALACMTNAMPIYACMCVCSPNKATSKHSLLTSRRLGSALLKHLSARLLLLHAALCQRAWATRDDKGGVAVTAVTVTAEGLLRRLRAADVIRSVHVVYHQ